MHAILNMQPVTGIKSICETPRCCRPPRLRNYLQMQGKQQTPRRVEPRRKKGATTRYGNVTRGVGRGV